QSVAGLLKDRLPATVELSVVAALMALLIGLPLGVYTALNPKGVVSQGILAISLVGISLPTFLIGILLILFMSVMLGWLPSYGRGEVVQIGWWLSGLLTLDGWRHFVLPVVTLRLFQLALLRRLLSREI